MTLTSRIRAHSSDRINLKVMFFSILALLLIPVTVGFSAAAQTSQCTSETQLMSLIRTRGINRPDYVPALNFITTDQGFQVCVEITLQPGEIFVATISELDGSRLAGAGITLRDTNDNLIANQIRYYRRRSEIFYLISPVAQTSTRFYLAIAATAQTGQTTQTHLTFKKINLETLMEDTFASTVRDYALGTMLAYVLNDNPSLRDMSNSANVVSVLRRVFERRDETDPVLDLFVSQTVSVAMQDVEFGAAANMVAEFAINLKNEIISRRPQGYVPS